MTPDRGRRAVLLVGHGATAKDCPRDLVMRLKALEAQRHRTGGAPTPDEIALDRKIRHWPRTPQNDPYKAGLEALAARLRPRLNGARLALAFNEFCAPTVADVVAELVAEGVHRITVVPSMLTPGGVHSEIEIPELIAGLRQQYPQVDIAYAWPFDLDPVAQMLADHLQRSES